MQGGEPMTKVYNIGQVQKAAQVSGTVLFDEMLTLEADDWFSEIHPITVPEGRSLTIRDAVDTGTGPLQCTVAGALEVLHCDLKGFSISGSGHFTIDDTSLAGNATAQNLASATLSKCLFRASLSLTVQNLDLSDSLFTQPGGGNDGFCMVGGPVLSPTATYRVDTCEFRTGDVQLYSGGAVGSVENSAFIACRLAIRGTAPTLPTVTGNSFFDGTIAAEDASVTSMAVSGNYWGGRLPNPETPPGGWLDDHGAYCEFSTPSTSFLTRGKERACSLPGDRPLPLVRLRSPYGYAAGTVTLRADGGSTARVKRDCLVCFDLAYPGEALSGAQFTLKCGGATFSPENGGYVVRRDHGLVQPATSPEAGERTLNFLLPASFTPSTNVYELWMDAETAPGYSDNPIVGGKSWKIDEAIINRLPAPARKLRVGVLAACLNVSGYTASTDRGNEKKGRPSSLSRVLERLRQDLVSHWALNDDEVDLVDLGSYTYEGGWLTSWLPELSSIGLMYSLAMELSDFRNTFNASQAEPLDALVCVVPATSLGAANEGASLRGFRRVALVDEGSPGAALHELGHAFGLYTGLSEQYNLATGTDGDGNPIVNGRGAVMHAATAFNSSRHAAVVPPGRIRHFPAGSRNEVYDFMGAKDPYWIVPSSLQQIQSALLALLGTAASPPIPLRSPQRASGGRPLVVRGLYRLFWNPSLGTWDTAMAEGTLAIASGAAAGLSATGNNGAWLNFRVDCYNTAGQLIDGSVLCRDRDFGQPEDTWLPWQQVFEVPPETALVKIWHTDSFANRLDLLAVRAASAALSNTLSAVVENLSTSLNVVVQWNSSVPTGVDAGGRLDQRLFFATNGVDWTPLRATYLTNRLVLAAESFRGAPQIWLRAVTSDGFGEAVSETGPLMLQRYPPAIAITAPLEGDAAPTNVPWSLVADISDPEDGGLTNCQWRSSVDGLLGTRTRLEGVSLSPGSHLLNCIAFDSHGLGSTATVHVTAMPMDATHYDLRVETPALTTLPSGADPAGDRSLRLVLNRTNHLTVVVRNQGLTNAAAFRFSVTPAGAAAQLLTDTTFGWDAFESRAWSWIFVPTSRVAHTLRAELSSADVTDTNPANNVGVWTITNHPPLARGARLEFRAGDTPVTNRLWGYDADDDPLAYHLFSAPAAGSVTLSASGFVYSVSSNFTGTDSFRFTAADGLATSTPATVFLSVLPPIRTPVITSALSTNGTQGEPFEYRIQASHGPIEFKALSLPAGLACDAVSGVISGVPAVAGTRVATLRAINRAGTGEKSLTFTLASGIPQVTSAPSAAQLSGQPFAYQITATCHPSGYDAFNLPAGLGVNRASGAITGACSIVGTYAVSLKATNLYGAGFGSLSVNICSTASSNDYFDLRQVMAGTNITFMSSTTAATRESGEPAHAGGWSPQGSRWWTWTAPRSGFVTVSADWCDFDTLLAVYTGTAIHTLSCVASNNNWRWSNDSLLYFQAVSGQVYQVAVDGDYAGGAFRFRLEYRQPPLIVSPINVTGVAGRPFTFQIQALNAPRSYGAVGLPAGLAVNTNSGLITGTPAEKTADYVALRASNAAGTDTQTNWFNIMSAAYPVFTNACHAVALAGQPFSFRLAATHALAGTYSGWPLPASLVLDANDGLISGTPWSAGIFHVSVSVMNAAYEQATDTWVLNVMQPYDDWKYNAGFTAPQLADPDVSGPDADADGDGMSNAEEQWCGSDPVDPLDRLGVLGLQGGGAWTQRIVRWQSEADHYYRVAVSTNLMLDFGGITGGVAATPPMNVLTDVTAHPSPVFYRIELDP
jgi:hypothetical protein